MAKPIQDHLISARVDRPTKKRYLEYIDDAHMQMGELIRKAIEEYITNHQVEGKPNDG